MGKIIEQIINDFSSGMTDDKRSKDKRAYSVLKHFDSSLLPHELVPQFDTEVPNGLSGGLITDLKLTRFLYAPYHSSANRLFALGDNGSGFLKVFKFDIHGAADLDTSFFVAATNGESASGARSETVFFYYKGFIYMYQGAAAIARFDTAESAGFADSWEAIDDATLGIQPLHHSSDDCAYFFGASNVYRLNGTSWEGNVLALPSDEQITARCEFGDYLAIATVTTGSFDKRSKVYLWDRDSSLTTLSERMDFGEGTIKHLGNLNNKLIAVMEVYLTNAYSLGRSKVVIKTPSGKFAVALSEIYCDSVETASDMPITDFIRNDRLYFPMRAKLNGDHRLGIWAVDQNGKFSIEITEPGLDPATHPSAAFRGIYATANIWWIAYTDGTSGAGNYSVKRTSDEGAFSSTNPSVYESLVFDEGDADVNKKLLGGSLIFESLPAGASVTLKYRKDGATNWITIFIDSSDGDTQHDAVNIESSGASLGEHKEFELRAESLGGAIITAIRYKVEVVDKTKY